MKRTLTLLMPLILLQSLSAQHISVESFIPLVNDMDARVNFPKTDPDGKPCAIVKVVTTETGFNWDVGMVGIMDAVRKTGEYWLYMRQGTQRITISHDKLGVLRNYIFPIPIESASVYEMRLVTGRIETTVIPTELESQWLLITVEPNTALIYLDDAFEATGTLQKRLLPGTYTYRIENNLYHTEAGRITVTSDKRAELSVNLKPNFGFIEVKSTPETGARVTINGKDAGFLTNGKSDQLQSGDYTVTIIKEQFQPASQQVTVKDNETTSLTLNMAPNFATVEVSLPSDATLFINNERRGTGNWSGRLNAGVYTFEARKDKHRQAKQDLQLQVGDSRSIELKPQPITGILDVVTTPPMANIKLNGKDYGTSPNTIRNLLIGEYAVLLEKQGHASVSKNITVTEDGPTLVDETLPAGMQATITSEPAGAELFINKQKVGTTPYTGQLSIGSHQVKLINRSKSVEESIQIAQDVDNIFSFNVFEFIDLFEDQLVFVSGGTFIMGCKSQRKSNCHESERPTHQVTVSDYYIGRKEITQKQWRDIMGDVPIKLRNKNCDNCPIEKVSWKDIQKFLTELNKLTGKNYRLPTEAEWEYAARGGQNSQNFIYSGGNDINQIAWYNNNSNGATKPVGQKTPNELGIHDMSGNVWEWCSNKFRSYSKRTKINPTGKRIGTQRVIRGGSIDCSTETCRITARDGRTPYSRFGNVGFRLAMSVQ